MPGPRKKPLMMNVRVPLSVTIVLLVALAGNAAGVEPSPVAGRAFSLEMNGDVLPILFTADGIRIGQGRQEVALTFTESKMEGETFIFTASAPVGNSHPQVTISGAVEGDLITGIFGVDGQPMEEFFGKSAVAPIDSEKVFAQARDLQLQRKPREAIPLFVQVIEHDRDDLAVAAPAVMHLVECFHLLKDDVTAGKQYQELAGKFLSHPPELDGSAMPTLDAVKEDLLWKTWEPGVTSRITFSVKGGSRERRLRDGNRQDTLSLQLDGRFPEDMNVISIEDSFASATFTGRNENGKNYTSKIGYNFIHRSSSGGFAKMTIGISFPDVPATVTGFASLTGSIRLRQAKDRILHEIMLHPGQNKILADGTSMTITGVDDDTVRFSVKAGSEHVEQTPAFPRRIASALSRTATGIGKGFEILDRDGKRLQVGEFTGDEAVDNCSLRVGGGRPHMMIYHEVTAISEREIPISISDVQLP